MRGFNTRESKDEASPRHLFRNKYWKKRERDTLSFEGSNSIT